MHAKDQKLFLLFLAQTVPNQVKLLLKNLTSVQRAAIKEVVINLLRGALQLTENQRKRLRKYRSHYRQIARGGKIKLLQVPIIFLLQLAKSTLEKL